MLQKETMTNLRDCAKFLYHNFFIVIFDYITPPPLIPHTRVTPTPLPTHSQPQTQ
jgi:hypothetical protein